MWVEAIEAVEGWDLLELKSMLRRSSCLQELIPTGRANQCKGPESE